MIAARLTYERWRRPRVVVPADATAGPAPAPDPPRPGRVEAVVAAVPSPDPAPAGSDGEPLRTSERVILHILRQGRLGPGELAPIGLSQTGIGEALGLRQSALAKALARLVAAGVLVVSRRHVERQSRRLKVYELTPLGEALARDLRRRNSPPPEEPRSRGAHAIWMGR